MKYLLCKGELLAFKAGAAIEAVTVNSGEAWVTNSEDTRDYCLQQGDRLTVRKGQRVVVEALQQTELTVILRKSRGDIRITLACPGQASA
ncbi:hypothetical protein Gbem_1703 [Citrifermentans bemidjiense Bem]|uniref:DUF2917 domain-containing protein n=1 Tax=Citrifermentans bemidjiense (strain ATCC BAA-1014 / DSM 16622 / JCM 12645 / Bem) TaxID=404380 RepID=B5E9H8_CITBB|nr:DUF2917 domain-containing protein [Citrifermentans bemidjiense]ACH38720.1 hypothetical protein Gbem_1703 [Citrifermentans bemidjiense Bem]